MEFWRPGNAVRQKLGPREVIVNRYMLDEGTDLDFSVDNDRTVVSSILAAHDGATDQHLWRLSGHDLQLHAFRVEGGYIEPQATLAIFANEKVTDKDLESFGPYEIWVAECGHKLPIAMVLPQFDAKSCVGCRVTVASPPGEVPATPTVRDWSTVEPLRRRQNAGTRRKLAPVTEIQI